MELGSEEHKRILRNSIIKIALKTAAVGVALGVFLIIPSFLRENTFSTGLAYAGQTIIIASILYAVLIAIKKYRKTVSTLDSLNDN